MKRNPNLHWKPPASLDLKGKSIAIVGGTGGIGRALSRKLADLGAALTVVGQTIRDQDVAGISFVKADLSLMREAARVADELPAEQLDMLIFTTGIFAAPKRQETAEGIERDMAVSFLNRLVMLRALAPRLGTAHGPGKARARVFVVGFPGSGQTGSTDDLNCERSYKAMAAHMNTVAGNEMLVLDGVKRYPELALFGLNPGLIKTNIRDNLLGEGSLKSRLAEGLISLFTPTVETYAARIVPLLLSPDLDGHSGALFDSKARAILPSSGMEPAHIARFLEASSDLVARAGVTLAA